MSGVPKGWDTPISLMWSGSSPETGGRTGFLSYPVFSVDVTDGARPATARVAPVPRADQEA
ncbi:hypothetical protein Misp05_35820 [Micromonospora sp. NBRC 107095]|nr:hypothetical protein Misp05_35820 [Micromonospora sp. NBRC 107095]